jgi:hypothetical protein
LRARVINEDLLADADPKALATGFGGHGVIKLSYDSFDNLILMSFVDAASLSATDATFGHPGTTYAIADGLRGLEAGSDTFTVTGNTVSFAFLATSGIDEIRLLFRPIETMNNLKHTFGLRLRAGGVSSRTGRTYWVISRDGSRRTTRQRSLGTSSRRQRRLVAPGPAKVPQWSR